MTRKRLACLFLTVLGAGACGSALMAAETAELRGWLDRMARAVESLNYQGTFVYWHDDQLEAMRIVHLVDDNGEHERLVALSGSKREIRRDNDNITCIFPDGESLIFDERITQRLFPAIPATQLSNLESHYSFSLQGSDRVAGLNAQAISIDPVDEFRYGYRLWLEENTGMLLKSTLVDEHGEPLEQLMFTSIKLGAMVTLEELESDIPSAQYVQLASMRPGDRSSTPAWHAPDLPAGFKLSVHDESINEQGAWMEHLVYSDGLASVSVYVEAVSASGEYLVGLSRVGVANAYGRQTDDIQVTVVGEVPAATVARIARSVSRIKLAAGAE